jgi:hypothetical protein
MEKRIIKINRAPVMTLWAKVVSEQLGYKRDEALSLAKAVAGLNAQSKGRRLGIYGEQSEKEKARPKAPEAGEQAVVTVLGRPVPVTRTKAGIRATINGEEIDPASVQRYLEKKFGPSLPEVESELERLAKSRSPKTLENEAYSLYEKIRPRVPEGTKGWGAAGELDLDYIHSLAE